jgi:hypothetical protein
MGSGQDSDEQDLGEQKSDQADDRDGDGQDYIDRSKVDFDPDDGLLSGTAIDGTSEIPGPHDQDESDESGDGQAPSTGGEQAEESAKDG